MLQLSSLLGPDFYARGYPQARHKTNARVKPEGSTRRAGRSEDAHRVLPGRVVAEFGSCQTRLL